MELKIRQLFDIIKQYGEMKQVYLDTYELLTTLRDDLRKGQYQLKDMVNFLYAMREISKLADDLRKESDGIGHMFENMICALYVTQSGKGPIQAALATGTPDLTLGVKIPSQSKEPERYDKFMAHFGIPKEASEKRIVKPYWPGICEELTRLQGEGKPLPAGINPDDTYPTYSVRVRGYKNLDEVLEQAEGKEVDACEQILTQRTT